MQLNQNQALISEQMVQQLKIYKWSNWDDVKSILVSSENIKMLRSIFTIAAMQYIDYTIYYQ